MQMICIKSLAKTPKNAVKYTNPQISVDFY